MGAPKNVVYRFAGGLRSDDLEMDRSGSLIFRKGDIFEKDRKQWLVQEIQWEWPDDGVRGVPLLRVYLTEALVN